ncbi:hypothetical protein E2562_034787 [Oryza meyeriana var. granulata]|uniref:Uncharacterized protein n=1 Tax=Oryza meyeriana var. granulata TaxID=110450 RepID=A0A6G1E6L8_9ORYZ|nr:hypothetical protein E2562_034787 [Oryza meyeriana var. granulata]
MVPVQATTTALLQAGSNPNKPYREEKKQLCRGREGGKKKEVTLLLVELVEEQVEGVILGLGEAGEEGGGHLEGIHLEGEAT